MSNPQPLPTGPLAGGPPTFLAGIENRIAGPVAQRFVYALLALAIATALTIVYLVDPRQPGLYPVCPFLGLTGCYCPGCGTLRALNQLMHGNFLAALGYNPYTILALPVIAYSFATGGLRAYGLPAPPRIFIPSPLIWALLVAVLAFWLVRNLPFASFSFLAPQSI